METEKSSLHGNAPDQARAALLVIDVINDLDFPGAEQLLEHAMSMARQIDALKRRAKQLGIPTIYVNDNFGRWRSNFHSQVEHCLREDTRGKPLVELLRPDAEDYFVLKPKHSGFYSTVLDVLLRYLGVENLIVTGIAGDNCVLFTANDAYLRDLRLFVPADCVASISAEQNRIALDQMHKLLKADIRPWRELNLAALNRD